MKLSLPYVPSLFRYVGPGPAYGLLQRVIFADVFEVICVQDCAAPRYSWLGDLEQFRANFVFVCGPAPSAKVKGRS